MKLYYSPGACSLAVHIVLEEIGLPYERELISSMDGSTESAMYLSINQKGRVPALDIGGTLITEVSAITTYLGMSYPQKALLPTGALGIARCLEWMSWLSSSVHALPVAQNWRTERFSDDLSAHEGIQAKGMVNLADVYQQIEQRLSGQTWAANDHYSIVDPYLLVFYRWGNRLGLDMNQFPNWTEHAGRMLQRPAVQAVLAIEGIQGDR